MFRAKGLTILSWVGVLSAHALEEREYWWSHNDSWNQCWAQKPKTPTILTRWTAILNWTQGTPTQHPWLSPLCGATIWTPQYTAADASGLNLSWTCVGTCQVNRAASRCLRLFIYFLHIYCRERIQNKVKKKQLIKRIFY